MLKTTTFIVLSALTAQAMAQNKVSIEFGAVGSYELWVDSSLPESEPVGSVKAETARVEFPLGSTGPDDKLFVWNKKSGNIAYRPVIELGKPWKINESDYRLIGHLTVHVQRGDKPADTASVTLISGDQTQTRLIDSSLKGDAHFFGIKPGTITIKVQYVLEGKTKDRSPQKEEINLKRDEPDPKIGVLIADQPKTASRPLEDSQKKGNQKSSQVPRRAFGETLISYIIGIGAVIALIYGLLQLMKNKAVIEKLKTAGINVCEPDESQDEPPLQPIKESQQPAQIIQDAAQPIVQEPRATTTYFPEPKLVRENGQILMIPEIVVTIGRDDSAGISLPNEASISRQHAQLTRVGQEVKLRDLGSTNGSYVNGQKLDTELTLKPGDTVQLGTIRFRFEV